MKNSYCCTLCTNVLEVPVIEIEDVERAGQFDFSTHAHSLDSSYLLSWGLMRASTPSDAQETWSSSESASRVEQACQFPSV